MATVPLERPGVLVLGGGGTLGEAWLRAVLAGIEAEAGWDLRDCPTRSAVTLDVLLPRGANVEATPDSPSRSTFCTPAV